VPPLEVQEATAGAQQNIEFFFAHYLLPVTAYEPDIAALRGGASRVVVGVGDASVSGELARDTALLLAERLGSEAVSFPGDHLGYVTQAEAFAKTLHEVVRAAEAGLARRDGGEGRAVTSRPCLRGLDGRPRSLRSAHQSGPARPRSRGRGPTPPPRTFAALGDEADLGTGLVASPLGEVPPVKSCRGPSPPPRSFQSRRSPPAPAEPRAVTYPSVPEGSRPTVVTALVLPPAAGMRAPRTGEDLRLAEAR
jgi:hypothetical protein